MFSKRVDVYSYERTYYDILTRKLPFEDHLLNDNDIVFNGQHLMLPEYMEV